MTSWTTRREHRDTWKGRGHIFRQRNRKQQELHKTCGDNAIHLVRGQSRNPCLFSVWKLVPRSHCLAYISCCYGRTPRQKQYKGHQGYSPSWRGSHSRWPAHIASATKKRRAMNICAQLTVSFFYTIQRMMPPTVGSSSYTSLIKWTPLGVSRDSAPRLF